METLPDGIGFLLIASGGRLVEFCVFTVDAQADGIGDRIPTA